MDIKRGYSEINISSDKGVDINEDMIGLFYEDISYAADGGLYAEQIENCSFKQQTPVFETDRHIKKIILPKLFSFIKKMGQPIQRNLCIIYKTCLI